MSFLLRAAQAFGIGPRRSPAQVADEIAEELAFHLELRARELEQQGFPTEVARARARELFGDVERTARECARIQLGGRLMLVRIQWVVIAVLLGLLGVLFARHGAARRELLAREAALRAEVESARARLAEERVQAELAMLEKPEPSSRIVAETRVAEPALESVDDVVKRMRASLAERPEDWRHAAELFRELLALPPEEGFRVLAELWPGLSATHKGQAIRSFSEAEHARMLGVIDLGATDESPTVQGRAFQYLRHYAFQNFAEDHSGYSQWAEVWRDRPLDEVLTSNARAFLQELRALSPFEVKQRLVDFEALAFHRYGDLGPILLQSMRDDGALAIVAEWLECPEFSDGSFSLGEVALSWAESLEPDETWLRTHVLPLVNHPDPGVAGGALAALGDPDNTWAIPEFLAALATAKPGSDELGPNAVIWTGAMALGEIGDPAAIPALIGMIAANPCYDTVYGIGYFGLGKLTGVSYDESHDGNWWIAWWELNKGRFPPEVSALSIPQY